jgi:hypothetical protein
MAAEHGDDPVTAIGSYYDKKMRIELLGIHKSGKIVAGECKYSQKPAEVHMLSALKEKCQKADLDAEGYVLFSKHGFAAELEQMAGENMILLSQVHLSSLLDHLTQEDLLVYTNRKY